MQDPVSLLRPGRRPLEVPIITIIIIIIVVVIIIMITIITFKATSTGGLLRWPSDEHHGECHGGHDDDHHDDCHGGHDGHGENQMYLLTLSIFR